MGFMNNEFNEESMEDLWKKFEAEADPSEKGDLLGQIFFRLTWKSSPRKAVAVGQAAADFYQKAGDEREAATALAWVGDLLNTNEQFADAEVELKSALALVEKLAFGYPYGNILHKLGDSLYGQGKIEEAKDYNAQAMQVMRDESNVFGASEVYYSLSRWLLGEGKYEQALATIDECLDMVIDDGNPYLAARNYERKGVALRFMGLLDQAGEALQSAKDIFEFHEDTENLFSTKIEMVELQIAQGCYSEALEAVDEIDDESKELKNRPVRVKALSIKAKLLLKLRNLDEAFEVFRQVATICDIREIVDKELEARFGMAEVKQLQGDLLGAEEHLFKAHAVAIKEGLGKPTMVAQLLLGENYLQREQWQRALEMFNQITSHDWSGDGRDVELWQARQLVAHAKAYLETGDIDETPRLLERVFQMNLLQRAPGILAQAYQIMAKTTASSDVGQSNAFKSQAIALHLKAGNQAEAMALAADFMPANNSIAIATAREQDGQLSFFSES